MRNHHPELTENVVIGEVGVSLEELVTRGEQFEMVWAVNVVEHSPDPKQLIQTLGKVTAPDGALLIDVPNDFSFVERDLVDLGAIKDDVWVAFPDRISYFHSRDSVLSFRRVA